jgi:hypothetical protein
MGHEHPVPTNLPERPTRFSVSSPWFGSRKPRLLGNVTPWCRRWAGFLHVRDGEREEQDQVQVVGGWRWRVAVAGTVQRSNVLQ